VFLGAQLGLDPLVALVLIIPAVMIATYPVQRALLNPLLTHGEEPPLVATFGLSLILETMFLLAYTSNPDSLNPHYAFTGVHIFGTTIRTVLVIAFGIGLALVVATHFGLTRTRFGKALRASAEDPEAAASLGINVKHVYALTFAIGSALSAFAVSLTPTAARLGCCWRSQ
jgi:branched-chain amino acid transport system permease protein